MKYASVDNRLFIENRGRFASKMQAGSVAVFHSNDQMPRSGDQTFEFRQQPDLFYLSGIDQEESILLLCPDAPLEKYREVLFIKRTNEHIAVWEGHKYTVEEARATSGIKQVYWLNEFEAVFQLLMHHSQNCYLNSNENDRMANEVQDRDTRFALKCRNEFPLHNYKRSAPILSGLRTIKSDIEVALIRHACKITEGAFKRVLKNVRPGQMEYEVEAEIIHEFISKGATGHAYSPIVAGGANACVLHYVDNNCELKDGELILMDFGAEYANYNADLSRTIPVNGQFTNRQRDVYNGVLNVQKQAISMLRPGATLDEYNKEIGNVMERELIELGLLSAAEVRKQSADKPLYKKYFMHGTAHFLGLDVHDIGDRYAKMQAGMVCTCEPGIYIPDENIGVRIENNILLTEGDPVDLTSDTPREVDEIESLMSTGVVA